ncbi:hypothetical protein FCULG_00002721 [Fusarium culmorum]|uniref:Uncharacterized protein n=1 Tax=Fusarium culmorum TaxID=5516 RepID=A0A2T4HAX5_FUSCU|nr:hypothetical protein FCULG_00002721 [Fusarium culmorum]
MSAVWRGLLVNDRWQVWDIFEGNQLFHSIDPEHHEYRLRANLAEIVALLGPPPKELLARGKLANKFFSDEGTFTGGINLPASKSLEEIENLLEGDEKTISGWAPERRSIAGELFQDAWLQQQA